MKKFLFKTINWLLVIITVGTAIGLLYTTLKATNPELVLPITKAIDKYPIVFDRVVLIFTALVSGGWFLRFIRSRMLDHQFHIDNNVIDVINANKKRANELYEQYEFRDNTIIELMNDFINERKEEKKENKAIIGFLKLSAKRQLESKLVTPETKSEIAEFIQSLDGKISDVEIKNIHKYIEVVHISNEQEEPQIIEEIDPRVKKVLERDENAKVEG